MDSFLSPEVRAGLEKAQTKALRNSSRLCVHANEEVLRIHETWQGGFSLPVDMAPALRGRVDVFDGPKHLYQCLIVFAEQQGDFIKYEYKRLTNVVSQQPVDFVLTEDAPIALLG
ncbi:hypothetical protein [Amylibacter marinus]|nr:hypothetical protein [Amylibacter marinus]